MGRIQYLHWIFETSSVIFGVSLGSTGRWPGATSCFHSCYLRLLSRDRKVCPPPASGLIKAKLKCKTLQNCLITNAEDEMQLRAISCCTCNYGAANGKCGRRGPRRLPLKCNTKVWGIAKSNLKTTEWKRFQLPAPSSPIPSPITHLPARRAQESQKLALLWQLWGCKRLQRIEWMSGVPPQP